MSLNLKEAFQELGLLIEKEVENCMIMNQHEFTVLENGEVGYYENEKSIVYKYKALEIEKSFSKWLEDFQKVSLESDFYYFDCPLKVYTSTYFNRLEIYTSENIDTNELDFIKSQINYLNDFKNNRVLDFRKYYISEYTNTLHYHKKILKQDYYKQTIEKKIDFLNERLIPFGYSLVNDDFNTTKNWFYFFTKKVSDFNNQKKTTDQAVLVIEKKCLNDVKKYFELIDSNKNWKYVFKCEKDYDKFCEYLVDLFFYDKVPNNVDVIETNKRIQTRTAIQLKLIFEKCSKREILKNYNNFFSVIKILSCFKDKTDTEIYNYLTK